MYDYFINVQEYLMNSSKKMADKIALICGDESLTYADIDQQSSRFASALVEQGLLEGDRVVISCGNSVQTVISFWAVLKAGGVSCIISDELPSDKINYILSDSGSRFFIGNIDINFDYLININQEKFNQLLHNKNYQFNRTRLDIDLAAIIYTSGSTANAKGVMMTHRNILAASTSINQYLHHTDESRILSALPLSFDYGLYQLIMAFSVGATLILEKNFILPLNFIKKISLQNVNVLPLVPTMIPLLNDYAEKFGLKENSVQSITNTGAALNPVHYQLLKKLFPAAKVFSMYGLTECKRCSYLPPEDFERKPSSVGIAIPNTQLWIEDERGNRLPPNQVGQLVIRGATVMKGYWNKPSETAKRLKQGLLPNEKVLHTGDYCWIDNDGYLYFHSRMDEMLKCKGLKVSPKEIEDALFKIDEIKEAVVVGSPCDVYGEAIFAFVTIKNLITEDEIKFKVSKKLSPHQRPKKIIILSLLPRTINGKYDRLQLRERVAAFYNKKNSASLNEPDKLQASLKSNLIAV
jgi:acyl-CoA synthetase (AMP-forming)/AMP-acid ligase II